MDEYALRDLSELPRTYDKTGLVRAASYSDRERPSRSPSRYSSRAHRSPSRSNFEEEDLVARANAVALPPIDGGRAAWTFALCSCALEMVVWGFPYSFGVFQQYYLQTPPFNSSSESLINSIGTVAIAIQFFITPFCITLASTYPRYVRRACWVSLAGYVASLAASSFARTASQLFVLQGVMIGICGGVVYAPVFVWLSEWFVEKRALSAAIIFGGSGIGGTLFPVLINVLLSRTGGFEWTLRILALFIGICASAALVGIKPRVPIPAPAARSSSRGAPRARTIPRPDLGFMKSKEFIAMAVTIMAQALAYYPVSLYIPAFTTAVGLSTSNGTIALAVFNLTGVIGQIIFGHACDKMDYTHIIIFSSVGSALSAFLMWGFAKSLGMIFAFVVVFGAVSSGFSSATPAASKGIANAESESGTQAGLIFGCFEVFRGVSVIVGPIISAHLHKKGSHTASVYGGYGFTQVELFVGSMMVLTAVGGATTRYLRSV